jgi:uncharacterized protein with NAD-binding domain and iron-sulfur cluster
MCRWGGLGAAYALAQSGAQVTVLDTAMSPGGLAAVSQRGGRTIEPGIKGFWRQYCNIDRLVEDLGLSQVFTGWTSSSFYSPSGLQVWLASHLSSGLL